MLKKGKLNILAKKSLWTIDILHGTEEDTTEEMVKMRPIILKRDNNTCKFCGFKSEHHMEIHHKNHDHDDYSEDNLETVCPFCHQAMHLPTAGVLKGGTMIWLPELSQEFLNIFCINLFLAMRFKPTNEMANSFYHELKSRESIISYSLGKKNALYLSTVDPSVFSEAMIKIEEENTKVSQSIMEKIRENVRILPSLERFQVQLDTWAEELKVNNQNKEENYFYKIEELYKKFKKPKV